MRRRWIVGLAVVTLVFLAAGIFVPDEHGSHHWWARIPGFFIFFGFAGCVALIVFAKFLGNKILLKDEKYYKDE